MARISRSGYCSFRCGEDGSDSLDTALDDGLSLANEGLGQWTKLFVKGTSWSLAYFRKRIPFLLGFN